jgi:hypothetical protein
MTAELNAKRYEVRSYEEGIEYYHRRGWTDGNPILLPTEDRVAEWFDQITESPGFIVGVSSQRNRTIRLEQVVINSIMAGCQPKHLPVVVAGLQAMLSDPFQHNHLASLGGPWPFFLVSGPVVDELGLNADQYALGPGSRANTTIARAISLTMWNCMEARIGGVQRGAYGAAWRNESIVPERPVSSWRHLSEDLGYGPEASTVTVYPATGFEQVLVHLLDSPEHILAAMIDSLATGRFVWGTYVLVFPPNMIAVFTEAGWTKDDVRSYVIERTYRSVAELKRRTRWAEQQAGRRPWPDLLDVQEGEEEEMIPLFIERPEYYDIAFRDKFLDSRGSGLYLMDCGGDSGPCAYILIPYTETGPVPVTKVIEPLVQSAPVPGGSGIG